MLAALIQQDSEPEQDSLLKLYWNRAVVKRELVTLKRDHYELLEKLEHQESAILRSQSQLEGLERLLTNPLAAANAMVYFQLRHMWRVASLKLEQFGKELMLQREKRERTQLHNAVLSKRNRRLAAIEVKLEELLQKRKRTLEECLRLEQNLARTNVLVRLFTGPSLRNRIQGMKHNGAALEERIEEFKEVIEKIQGEPLPEPDGLSLESRRLINMATISLAQHLTLHFAEHDLARLAKKATKRSVADMKFGDRRVCDQMVERVREKVDALNSDKRLPDQVKRRADMLMNKVKYQHESDATPANDSLSEIVIAPEEDSHAQLERRPLKINVLEDDFWDLSEVLS